MAGIKINQYPLERLTFGDDDYYDIDYWNGTAFETAKIKGSVIKLAIQAGIVSNNLFTADLNLLNNRNHQLNNKDFKLTYNSTTIGRNGNFKFSDSGFAVFCNKTLTPTDFTNYLLDVDGLTCQVAGTSLVSGTTFYVQNGKIFVVNGNNSFSFDAINKLTKIEGTNGDITIGDPTNNTNTFYNDISTNLYGIILKGFGETSETDATGANYATLVGTSLVPKKYVDDAIASTPASNISNSDLTFNATYNADLNGNDWSIKNGATTLFDVKSTGNLSLETNTTVKGSDNSASTTGFKVTDINDDSLLEVKNNGVTTFGKYTTPISGSEFRQHFIGKDGRSDQASSSCDFIFEQSNGIRFQLLSSTGKTNTLEFQEGSNRTFIQSAPNTMSFYNSGTYWLHTIKNSHTVYSASFANSANVFKEGNNRHLFIGELQMFAQEESTDGNVNLPSNINLRTAYKTTGGVQGSNNVRIGANADNVGNYSLVIKDDSDVTKFEFRHNGYLSLPSLPSLSTGVGAGDVWSQNGTLRIGSATANIQTVATVTVLTPNADTTKMEIVSALSNTLTIATPTGTPTEGQELTFRFKDNGTARLVVWDAGYEDYTGSLPNTTIANKTVYIGCKYNAVDTKWDVVAIQNQP